MTSDTQRRTISDAHRAKVSEANRRRVVSEETRRKLSDAVRGERNPMWGKTLSAEARAKISAAHKGKSAPWKSRPFTEEHCRKISEANKGKMRGPENPNWRGGGSFEPYCVKFNESFKERVREFFGRQCVECGAPENGVRLSVHHVNFRKDACCADDVVPLFVPLCRRCHAGTNYNREYWEARFTTLINEQYGGRCYLPK